MTSLCIDFGGTRIKLGVLDVGTVVAASELAPTDSPADLDEVRASVAALVGPGAALDGVGVAMPGVVAGGALHEAYGKYEWARGVDLASWAARAFGALAVVENDARAALLGETTHGAAAGARDAVLITLGTGVGTAALVGGELVRGRHGHAGILGGHVTVDLAGPVCNCGNIGCVEAVASTWALAREAAADPALSRALDGADAGLKGLFDRAADPAVGPVLDRFLRAWGAAVVAMCHAYDPEVVALSGGALRSGRVIERAIRGYVADHLWSGLRRPDIVVAADPGRSVLQGLSALVESAREASGAASDATSLIDAASRKESE